MLLFCVYWRSVSIGVLVFRPWFYAFYAFYAWWYCGILTITVTVRLLQLEHRNPPMIQAAFQRAACEFATARVIKFKSVYTL